MIDLHLHTTISDGRLTPPELVDRVSAAGVRVMSVTDHDTTLATAQVRPLAAAAGIEAVSGIEITAVERSRDVHLLGYFVREDDPSLAAFLSQQRDRRLARVEAIAERLASLGMPIAFEPIVAEARLTSGRSVGRPQIARAMMRAGYVATMNEAFEKWLGHGGGAFVAREGPTCEAVIEAIHNAGGVASLAHPGKTDIDGRIAELHDAGLDALEAHHSDHDTTLVAHYLSMARSLGMLVSGGSDFHGDPQQNRAPGSRSLPEPDWLRLKAAAAGYV